MWDIHWPVTQLLVKWSLTSKRTTKSELAAAGSAPAGVRKPRRTGSMHSAKPSTPATTTEQVTPIDAEAVAHLAYSFYEARGYVGGSPEEDWLRAERELMNR